jgi:hypothetical protein
MAEAYPSDMQPGETSVSAWSSSEEAREQDRTNTDSDADEGLTSPVAVCAPSAATAVDRFVLQSIFTPILVRERLSGVLLRPDVSRPVGLSAVYEDLRSHELAEFEAVLPSLDEFRERNAFRIEIEGPDEALIADALGAAFDTNIVESASRTTVWPSASSPWPRSTKAPSVSPGCATS